MDLKEIWRDDRDCIHLDQDRNNWWTLVNMAMNLWVSGSVGSQSATLQVTNAMKIITTGPTSHTSDSSVPPTVQRKLQLETTNTTPEHIQSKLTWSTTVTWFPRTNMPTGEALRLGRLRTLWPDAPHFTTWYSPGPHTMALFVRLKK